jgi:GDP-D-mannose dehydratase
MADPSRARRELGWHPEITFTQLVAMMVDHEQALCCEHRDMLASPPG